MSGRQRSIVVILLLLFLFPVGFVLMWFWSGWERRIKWLVTGVTIILPAVIMFLALASFFAIRVPEVSNQAVDQSKRSNVNQIVRGANLFYADYGRYPASLAELESGDKYVRLPGGDGQDYTYVVTEGGKNCEVKTRLSDGNAFSLNCVSNPR